MRRLPTFAGNSFTPSTTLLLLVLGALIPSISHAASQMPSAANMFENFSEASLALMDVVVVASYVVGIFVTCLGLWKFKEYSEQGGRVKFSTPLGLVAVGTFMVVMPGMLSMATETLSLGANMGKSVLSQGPSGSEAAQAMSGAIRGILLFVKLIGHIAFFRGLFILKGLAEGNQQATMGRALTHLFGGAAAINIQIVAQMLSNTFGMPLLI